MASAVFIQEVDSWIQFSSLTWQKWLPIGKFRLYIIKACCYSQCIAVMSSGPLIVIIVLDYINICEIPVCSLLVCSGYSSEKFKIWCLSIQKKALKTLSSIHHKGGVCGLFHVCQLTPRAHMLSCRQWRHSFQDMRMWGSSVVKLLLLWKTESCQHCGSGLSTCTNLQSASVWVYTGGKKDIFAGADHIYVIYSWFVLHCI